MASENTTAADDISTRTIRRLRNRLIPLLFLPYVVAFLDRTNIGFAALTMNGDLAINSAQFGLLTGIFFWGYFLFEIPSNLLQSVSADLLEGSIVIQLRSQFSGAESRQVFQVSDYCWQALVLADAEVIPGIIQALIER